MALRALSLGAGVQSTTVALMASRGLLAPPTVAIFADTGWEPRRVYEHLAWLRTQLPFPVHVVTGGNLRENVITRRNTDGGRYAAIPFYIVNPDGSDGLGRRQCTSEYKLKPIHRELRRLLGKGPNDPIPPASVELLIGISADEAHRAKTDDIQYIRKIYPLLDLNMTRADCHGWLQRHGYPTPPKSACIGCPFTSDRRWMQRKSTEPEEWADAVRADRELREGGGAGMHGQEFMHAQRVPLDQVDFSQVDPDRQPDLFGNECEGLCGV